MTAPAFAHPALIAPSATTMPPVAAVLIAAAAALVVWETRSRTRAALRRLPPEMYPDLGLTAREVTAELAKPFWRA